MTSTSTAGGRNNSRSLRRALGILLKLGEDTAPASGARLSVLAEDLSLSKSTMLRLLAPLIEARLVVRDDRRIVYRLGPRTAQLGQTYLVHLDLGGVARKFLLGLVDSTGETAHLVIADLPEVVYIDKADSPHPVRMYSRIGSRMAAYCTSVGKAILAHATDETVGNIIASGMPARTPNTHTTARDLLEDLADIRDRGYAVDNSENETGIRCVGAPLFDDSGLVTSAISISGPANRITAEREAHLGALVLAAADTISGKLGARR